MSNEAHISIHTYFTCSLDEIHLDMCLFRVNSIKSIKALRVGTNTFAWDDLSRFSIFVFCRNIKGSHTNSD